MKKYFLIILLLPQLVSSSIPIDSKYYLIDTLNYKLLDKDDKVLIDSCLNVFYSSNNDSIKIRAIEYIVDQSNDLKTWGAYNFWLHDFLKNKIDLNLVVEDDDFLLYSYSNTLSNIAFYYDEINEWDLSIKYYKNVIQLNKKINDLESLSSNYNNLGYVFNIKGDFKKASKYYFKALEIRINQKDSLGVANTLNNIGSIFIHIGEISKGLDYYFKSLKIQEKLNNKIGIATSLNNIGLLFLELKEYDKALKYFEKSNNIFKQIKYIKGEITILNNIALVYDELDNKSKAIKFYNQSLNLSLSINDSELIGRNYNNIGEFYLAKDSLLLAKEYFNKSFSIFNELDSYYGLSTSYSNLGKVYYKLGNYKSAEDFLKKALSFSKQYGFIKINADIFFNLKQVEIKKSNYKKALEYQTLFLQYRDSITNEKNLNIILQRQYRYDLSKQQLIQKQKYEKSLLIQKKDNEKNKQIAYVAIISLIIVLFLLIYLINKLILTRKQKQIIEKQKKEVETSHQITEEQKLIIEEKNKNISDSINYAQKIQEAILPNINQINETIKDGFIFFKPKDVVGGDFYWIRKYDNYRMIACIDCTGHGVPGAFMTMLSRVLLRESATIKGYRKPNEILSQMDESIRMIFKQKGYNSIQDGLDISLAIIDEINEEILFSSAQRQILINFKEEKKLHIIKGDKYAVGGFYEKEKVFKTHTFSLKDVDSFYLFTDGYVDQFGGENGKKFKFRPFKDLIESIMKLPMNKQHKIIINTFEEWKGETEQIDDVCVMGIKI